MKISEHSIERLFDSQDKIVERAVRDHKKEYEFIKDCIELVLNRQLNQEKITTADKEKLYVVHEFLNDACSTLINSFRIGLYGCPSDSMALLRVVIELLAIMNYIVENGYFKIAKFELGNNRFKKLRFENVIKSIKDRKDVHKLHQKISRMAAHATAQRIMANSYDLNNQNLPTVGMAIDPRRTRESLHEIMRASLYMIRILNDLYKTKKEIISEDFLKKAEELEKKFKAYRQ